MRKIYSLVLMATALLIGTNAWATVRTAGTADELKSAWENAEDGDEIQLTASFSIGTTLWLGTEKMNDDPMSITLNLNGDTLSSTAEKVFVLTHGSLNVIGNGGIKHDIADATAYLPAKGEYNSAYEIFRVLGSTYKDINPKEDTPYYTHLTIGADVKLVAAVNGIVVDYLKAAPFTSAWAAGNKTVPTWTSIYTNVYNTAANKTTGNRGVANGVRLDVLGTIHATKYAIKSNGFLGSTSNYPLKSYANKYYQAPGVTYAVAADDDKYSPYIVIGKTAELLTLKPDRKDAVAAYSGGYARWYVEGSCIGSTGVYLKSGEIVLNDAVVASNYSGNDYTPAKETSSGVECGGSGIVMQSSTAYAGDISVTVQGDTKVTGTSGYAIDEAVTATADSTKVDVITISGGTFESGSEGTMRVTETTAVAAADPTQETTITIIGGNADNTSSTIGTQTLENYLSGQSDVHVTVVDNGQGGTTLVISEGDAPTVANSVKDATSGTSINWQNTGTTEETLDKDLTLGDLEITQAYAQKLTIPSGKTLTVERVILGAKAQIIVEAGGKFIVKGEQGIVAPVAENIVLKNEEGKRSIFLFNPDVTSNKHPNATVELTTKSWWKDAEHYQWENFGIPTHNALKSITCEKVGGNVVYEEIQTLSNGSWVSLGYIGGTYSIDVTKLSKPFAAYNIIAYRDKTEDAPKCIMTGELVGNTNNALDANMKWSAFGNSYTAEIDAVALIAGLNNVDKGVYVSEYQGNGELAWNTYAAEDAADDNLKIAPMQSFLLLNKGAYSVEETINYANMVYAPATAAPATAPRRSANNNTTKFRVIIANKQGVSDNVKLRESATATTLEKYMNDDVNIYVMADEKNAVFASEDLENTYLGVSTVKGGMFTISFAKVEGRELTLIDHETGAQVAIAEGNTYEFTAAANSANDYRFEIVSAAKMPTAIENTEAVKSAKGVYTITGQYVGEMNVWNTLPAGIYVVNGEKRVK